LEGASSFEETLAESPSLLFSRLIAGLEAADDDVEDAGDNEEELEGEGGDEEEGDEDTREL
jgi:hypothetical protein